MDEHTFLYTASAFYQTALTLAELEGRYGELGYLRVSKSAVINLHRIRKDRYGKLWVTSRGDYNTIPRASTCSTARTRIPRKWW